jgi:hypothetical protein
MRVSIQKRSNTERGSSGIHPQMLRILLSHMMENSKREALKELVLGNILTAL